MSDQLFGDFIMPVLLITILVHAVVDRRGVKIWKIPKGAVHWIPENVVLFMMGHDFLVTELAWLKTAISLFWLVFVMLFLKFRTGVSWRIAIIGLTIFLSSYVGGIIFALM